MSTPFKMKGSPMQRNFKDWWKESKLGKDIKKLGTKVQKTTEKIKTSTPTSRGEAFTRGFSWASELNRDRKEKGSAQISKLKNILFKPKKKK
jgi:hypothetical protein